MHAADLTLFNFSLACLPACLPLLDVGSCGAVLNAQGLIPGNLLIGGLVWMEKVSRLD